MLRNAVKFKNRRCENHDAKKILIVDDDVDFRANLEDILVILCTGFSEIISKTKSDQIGARKLLMKPLITSELAIAIRQVLDES